MPNYDKKKQAENVKRIREEDPVRHTCIQMRSASKRRNNRDNNYNLTVDFLVSIAPKFCPVMKTKIKYGGGKISNNSASIDRINPLKGYVKGNVQIISNLANMMKNCANKKELKLFANWVNCNH